MKAIDNISRKSDSDYEPVFTVTDYYDGPRRGIANYLGNPHFYECEFDHDQDEYTDRYLLTPVSNETLQLAMEAWEIWKRWESAFHTGWTDISSHPAMPEDRPRHEALKRILDERLVTDKSNAMLCTAEFQVYGSQDLPRGVIRPLRVKWSEL